ncbi:MAG: tetratricopeptide repeat protein [Gammaproteobacteria bacterium]
MSHLRVSFCAAILAASLAHAGVVTAAAAKVPAANTHVIAAKAQAASTATAQGYALTLAEVSALASAGATGLASQLIAQQQPDFKTDPVGWMSWERERIYIYQSTKQWQQVTARVEHLPDGLSPDFHAWEQMQAADAWLHLGKAEQARSIVRPLIWAGDTAPDDATLSRLRQLVIRSYLADKDLDDAQSAVIRYRLDYPQDAGDWPLLEARLFLRAQQPQSALDVLKGSKGDTADMLRLLAGLRAGGTTPGDALAQAVSIGTDDKASADERVQAWAIAAQAADDLKNPLARIKALQNGLGLQPGLLEQDELFALTPDMLWDAYLAYGQDLGNQLQLVVGDDQGWFLAASNQFDSDPVSACALFTVVAFNAIEPHQRDVAHWQFATLIQKQRDGANVLRHLYLDSSRFKTPEGVPADVRYILADDVLDIPDIPLASRLMQGLDTAPPDTDPAAWQLQRARVFVLGGKPDAGIKALDTLFKSGAGFDPGEVLPVLFDLQTIGRDKDAIPFFEAILNSSLQDEQRRQLLYWTADSYKALGDYSKAAELYLRSATLNNPYAMDQWAQTSRYQAAKMLAKTGLTEDARRLYNGLMNATQDPARQAVLRHDIQQLLLTSDRQGVNDASPQP